MTGMGQDFHGSRSGRDLHPPLLTWKLPLPPRLRSRALGARRVTALLLEEDPRDMLEELPRHVGVLLGERPEVPELDRVAAHRRQRLDGGRALAFADHRELAEVI